jgi:hypothetical protein
MAECESFPTCPFFDDQMRDMPATAEVFKAKYCRGDKSSCARYMIQTKGGGVPVPSDLFPNQAERARMIISGSRV